ncbi:HAD family hydrolase [Segetibacter sp. 3557_3]|uniref:HAD family hydrolase n=1 Tax=Segetibacter sp. 3557_3 TaxID=2547429 RepID=UPI00105841F5|nr:HAD family hydrolase [Segetibacter sp. 3557_3]TDH21292.1 HAD family hydrolase [Segetibacter sp. 3557_3]
MIRAYIFDLDNTLYPVESIAGRLFEPLQKMIEYSGKHDEDFDAIRKDLMWKPFQVVAEKYGMGEELTRNGIEYLRELTYEDNMVPFEGYELVKSLKADRFIVTMGFRKLQQSKFRSLGIEDDFTELIVVDPETQNQTKKDIFADIQQRYGYEAGEMVIVGDDPDSEIKGGNELGMITVLFDHSGKTTQSAATYTISRFDELPV